MSTPSNDPIEVLIAHAQSLGDAWSRYVALSQTLYPGRPVAEMARQRWAEETGEHIIGPDHWMFQIELAIVEDFRRACAARRYSATGRAAGSLTETPLPADLYQNAGLRIVRGELLLFPPRPPRPIKIVRVSAVPAKTMRLSPEWDLMLDEKGNIAMLSGDAAIEQDAECARRQFEDETSQVVAAVAAIQAHHPAAEAPEESQTLGWQRRKWRRQWIAKFAGRQRSVRRWIAVADLVDWCAQSTTAASIEAEAKARDVAYRRLTESVQRGEFERGDRSKILYLDTQVMRCRLTREQFEIAFNNTAGVPWAPSLPLDVLRYCWLPRELARQWIERHDYIWPAHFNPVSPGSPQPKAATGTVDRASETIALIEAVHDLRVIRGIDLRSAIIEMNDLLATGQVPSADALIDGVAAKIDARWWWASTNFEYPNSSVVFNLVADGEPRITRATEIALNRGAWERQRSRILAAARQDSGPFPHWDNPAWDHPRKLLDAIRLWSPDFAQLLDQLKWPSAGDILNIAQQRQRHRMLYDHPASEKLRQRRKGGAVDNRPEARDHVLGDEIPEPIRDDLLRCLREWDRWDDTDRIVNGSELAARLIIQKTGAGQPYILKYAPPATEGLGAAYRRVGDARHDALGSHDFDIRHSTIRDPRGSWLPSRISGGIDAEAERMRLDRLDREARDAAATAAWDAECAKPMHERQYFLFGEIADKLATDPESLEIDAAKRARIVRDLADWTSRGEFGLLGDSEVVALSAEPPHFLPIGPVRPGAILVNPEGLILRREACNRYLSASRITTASRLLNHWFPKMPVVAPSSQGAETEPIDQRPAVKRALLAAIRSTLKTVGVPGKTAQWKTFCAHVRMECAVTANTRGYGDKSIQRLVTAIKAAPDKEDKTENSPTRSRPRAGDG